MLAGNYLVWFAAQVVSIVIILYFVLRWRPGFLGQKTITETLKGMLAAREALIKDQLEAAERSRQEAARIRDEAAQQVVQARTEASGIVERARSTSEAIHEELVTRAREEYDRIVGQAKDEIEYERRQAELALRRRAADIVVDAASQIVRGDLARDTDRRLIKESLVRLGEDR